MYAFFLAIESIYAKIFGFFKNRLELVYSRIILKNRHHFIYLSGRL